MKVDRLNCSLVLRVHKIYKLNVKIENYAQSIGIIMSKTKKNFKFMYDKISNKDQWLHALKIYNTEEIQNITGQELF